MILGIICDSLPLIAKMFEKVSIQSCEGGAIDNEEFVRLGSKALYAFVYPNFMINRLVILYFIVSGFDLDSF